MLPVEAQAARRALGYLEKGPIAEGRWEDFETYFSCCRWGTREYLGRRIERQVLELDVAFGIQRQLIDQ